MSTYEVGPVYFDDNIDEPPVVELTIATRKPEKWRFVDLVTGQIWMHEGGKFVIAPDWIPLEPELSEGGDGMSTRPERPTHVRPQEPVQGGGIRDT